MVRSAEVVGAGCGAAEAQPSRHRATPALLGRGKATGRAGGSSTARRFTRTTADTISPEPSRTGKPVGRFGESADN
ncbi:MAG TPA: hypothetical protein VFV38_35240 [Ktedonobacteraceae bacterium]|nr:hypothetical protein [Ktedonobacteraceae bacterium]